MTRTERRSGDRLITYGRVPGDFHDLVRFFDRQLPAAGFTVGNAEVDPHDAEADFAGGTVRGRWNVGVDGDCAGTSSLTMLVLPVTATTSPS